MIYLFLTIGAIAAVCLVKLIAGPFLKVKNMRTEIERRGLLLDVVNHVALTLTGKMADGQHLEDSLNSCMQVIGKNLRADSVLLWKNETDGGGRCAVLDREWLSTGMRERCLNTEQPVRLGFRLPYKLIPEWEHKLIYGEHINSPTALLTPEERSVIEPFAIKSIIIIPLFLDNQFWGILSLNDYEAERTLSYSEISILRGAGMMIAVAADRGEQERKTQAAQEYVKIMMDALPLVCVLFNSKHEIIGCNKQALTLFEFENLTELKEQFFSLAHEYQPDGMPSVETANKNIDKAFGEGRHTFLWTHKLRNGADLPVQINLVRVVYENDYAVAGYMRDLREYNQMIADIEQRDALLYAVNRVAGLLLRPETDNFSNVMGRCMEMMAKAADADRMYIWKNYTENGSLYCVQIYEWSENVLSSQECGVGNGVLYDDVTPRFKEIFLRGENVNSLVRNVPLSEQPILAAQGILSILLVPIFIRDEFWGFVGFDNCHSERLFTANEETILQSTSLLITNALLRDEYIRNIQETSAKLETALKETKNANSAKSDFLASMSHEMRTPLNAIIGLSELTLENNYLSGDAAANVEKIYNSGSMLLGIVNDILDISKIEAGKFEMVQNEYYIPSVVNDSVTQNILRISGKPIKFTLNINENTPECLYGDSLLVRRIINNLLSNAFKYTEKGTVELAIVCEREGGDTVWLTIRVSDTGIGIRPQHLKRIFSDYEQFDTMSNHRAEGTGLGLSITKRLACMMGGAITAESDYGKGSAFTVKIRQRYVKDSVIGPEVLENLKGLRYSAGTPSRYLKLNRLRLPYARVLVVDDNLTNLDVAKGFMTLYEMKVDCVTSGKEAVEAVRECKVKYDAIFMDHMMPIMDGVEATRVIRKEIGTEYAENVPIIALTANAIAGKEEMFLSSGFQAFMAKPIDLFRLDEVIRSWLLKPEKETLFSNSPAGNAEGRGGKDAKIHAANGYVMHAFAEEIDGLDLMKGLKSFNSEEAFLRILRVYAVNTKPLLDSIAGVSEKTLPEYLVTIHGIKSSSKGICAETLGNFAESLEDAARAGSFDFVAQNTPAFVKEARRLIKDIETMLDKIAGNAAKPKKDKPDSEVLTRLCSACNKYDIIGIDAAMEEIERYEYTSDGGLVGWLRDSITQMNFTQAAEKISHLKLTKEEGMWTATVKKS